MKLPFCTLAAGAALLIAGPASAQTDWTGMYLYEGRLADGAAALETHLAAQPGDDEALFALGVTQFLQAVEGLGQTLHRHGAAPQGPFARTTPFLRLPVPPNANPQPVTNDDLRTMKIEFLEGLARAEATLAQIDDPNVKFPLAIGLVRLDLDGDGVATDAESLWRVFDALNRRVSLSLEQAEGFIIHLDEGDALWLRGYCHLLSGIGEVVLAHDTSTLFERAAHQFFPQVDTPMGEVLREGRSLSNYSEALDAIATIHSLQLPVLEPQRLPVARQHLLRVLELSEETWDAYLAETDNDLEWIPNPSQDGVLPNSTVTEGMVTAWRSFLNEAHLILDGEVLLPYWRGTNDTRGVNLRKAFEEPRDFDFVLWIQGSAAIPYLEQGTVTDDDFWRQTNQTFNGRFLGFALWFN